MNKENKTILITGATGHQGGAVACHLLNKGWQLRALTRDPQKELAQQLAQAGIEVVQGDYEDETSLKRALQGAYGVYSVQTFMEAGVEGEVRQGKKLADLAKAAEVQHFVYSSVGGADRNTGIPHFESKWQIEQHIRSLELPATILRPVFFMENFLTYFPLQQAEGKWQFTMPMPGDCPLAMVAVEDIGRFAALAFERPQEWIGQAEELAGDEKTPEAIARDFSQQKGEVVRFQEAPLDAVGGSESDLGKMFRWFVDVGYEVDVARLKALLPELKNFQQWLKDSGI